MSNRPAGGPPLRWIAGLVVLWLAMMPAAGASGRAWEEPTPIAPLRIQGRGGEVGAEVHLFQRRERFDNAASEEVSLGNRTTRQYIMQRFMGYVYHPRLLDVRGRIELGLMQQALSRSGAGTEWDRDSSWSGVVGNYDVQARLFKDHPLSALLTAGRDRRAVIEIFTDRHMVETEQYGAILDLKTGPFPAQLSLNRALIEEFGFQSRGRTRHDTLQLRIRNELANRVRTELQYRFQDVEQRFEARTPFFRVDRELDYHHHDLQLTNTIDLTADGRHQLHTLGRVFRQSGDIELDSYYLQQRLRMRHTPAFRTYALASLLHNRFGPAWSTTLTGETGLDYRLYRSLDMHFNVHGRRVDFNDTTDTEYGFTGRLDYRKTTPLGLLTAGYALTHDWIERTGPAGARRIFQEQLVLSQAAFSFLSRPGAIPSSLRVTLEPLGAVPLIEGFDFEARVIGNRLGLRALPGGTIPDGTTVFVDYDVVVEPLDYRQIFQSAHVRHDFNRLLDGLALYLRYHSLAARDLPADDLLTILEYDEWLAGMQYRWRWLTGTAEYLAHDSNFLAYDSVRLRLEGHHRIARRARLGWYGSTTLTDYDRSIGGLDRERIHAAGLTLGGQLGRRGYWELEGRARRASGLIDETLLGVAARLGLNVRRLRVEGGARFEQIERGRSERDNYQLYLRVAREFGRGR